MRFSKSRGSHRRAVLECESLESRIVLDNASGGPNGVGVLDAKGHFGLYYRPIEGSPILLDGTGVRLGQIEDGAVGRPGFDGFVNTNRNVAPVESFFVDNPLLQNSIFITDHAITVAGVIIDTGRIATGIANSASLYSAAVSDRTLSVPVLHTMTLQSLFKVATASVDPSFQLAAINASFVTSGTADGITPAPMTLTQLPCS